MTLVYVLHIPNFRFPYDLEATKYAPAHEYNVIKVKCKLDGVRQSETASRTSDKKYDRNRKSLNAKVLSRVFSEDYERLNKKILDPRGHVIRRWNKFFLVSCLVSLFVDPLLFYLPFVKDDIYIDIGVILKIVLTVIRSIADIFYVI